VDIFLKIGAIYIIGAFFRDIYRLSVGFFYTPPVTSRKNRRGYKPLVTVVIPAWNEEVGIIRTVRSVLHNSYKNIEVIVVDDGSTDETAKRVQSIVNRSKRVRLISQINGGKSSALNTGIAAAKGELILTLDADSYLEPASLSKMVATLSNKKYGVAIGEVVVGNLRTWLGRAQHYEYSVGFHLKRSQHLFNSAYIFPGALTMFRKAVLEEIGQFTDYSSTEDLDISLRIKQAGHKIAYVESALCVTEGATTIKGLLNQRTRWRHGYLECLLRHKEFLLSPKKGWYLTLVDLPMQLLGVFEVLLFPFILAMLVYSLTIHVNPIALVGAYCLMPLLLLMLGDLRDNYRQVSMWVFAMPIILMFIEGVEYVALLKAIYRTVRRRKTTWTVWQRTGATN